MNKLDGSKAWLKLILPVMLAIGINILSRFPQFIERYYSAGLYPAISTFMRLLFGWIPFSIGDILYSFAVIWIIVRLFKTFKTVFKRRVTKGSCLQSLRKTFAILMWVYIFFYSLWGLNYSRLGIAYQLKLEHIDYSTDDLKILTSSLIKKINNSRHELGDTVVYPSSKVVFTLAKEAYTKAQIKFPFLDYQASSIKSSMWGWLGNYTGFLGYYNPFSAEAQVNTTVPDFVIPFTTSHEIGHQLGYGT
ncbi:MAG: DUF3810 domain-containing protein, partial [Panacibacter sp.]